jgi:Uncharacterised protein conserved in bacteria (DUF2336)
LQEEIRRVLTTIANAARGDTAPARDFSRAEAAIKRMKGMNELNDTAIGQFATYKKFDEVAAALALLNNSAPTELMAKVLEGSRADLILIPCKSAGLSWPTVEAILYHRPVKHRLDEATLRVAHSDYGKLSIDTAQRTVRFWQLHKKIEKIGA